LPRKRLVQLLSIEPRAFRDACNAAVRLDNSAERLHESRWISFVRRQIQIGCGEPWVAQALEQVWLSRDRG